MSHATGQGPSLWRLWHDWTEVVELYARRRARRRWLRPEAYARLHHELLAACRSQAAAGGKSRAFYEQLLDLAQPWLALGALEMADRDILADLWLRCRAAGMQLGGQPWTWKLRPWLARIPAALLLGAMCGGGAWLYTHYGATALRVLRDEGRPLLLAVRQLGNLSLLAVFALVVVGAGAYLVLRIARS
jgi:hypothetical protein